MEYVLFFCLIILIFFVVGLRNSFMNRFDRLERELLRWKEEARRASPPPVAEVKPEPRPEPRPVTPPVTQPTTPPETTPPAKPGSVRETEPFTPHFIRQPEPSRPQPAASVAVLAAGLPSTPPVEALVGSLAAAPAGHPVSLPPREATKPAWPPLSNVTAPARAGRSGS